MARLFNDGASNYAEFAGAVVTAMPLTLACWFRPDDVGIDGTLVCLDDGASSNNSMYRLACGGSGGDKVRANLRESLGTEATATSTTTIANGRWDHAAGVFTSTTSRDCFHNGAKTSNGSTINPAAPSRTRIGALHLAATGRIQFWSGDVAEAAIWNVALTDDEIASLAKGVSPLLIRPEALVHYWPLIGRTSPEIDIMGAAPLTLSGTSAASHPRVIMPRRRQAYSVAGGAPSGAMVAALTGGGSVAGTLGGSGALAAPLTGTGAAAGTLAGAGVLAAGLTGAGDLPGTLTGAGALASGLTGAGTLTGTFSGTAPIAADLNGSGTLAGTLAGAAALVADLGGSASITATLNGERTVAFTGSADLSGTLTGAGAMAAALTGTGTLTGAFPSGLGPPRGLRFTTPANPRFTTPAPPRFTERSA